MLSDNAVSLIDVTTGGQAYETDRWAHFAVCISLDAVEITSTIILYVNGLESQVTAANRVAIDYSSFLHVLGAEYNTVGGARQPAGFFTGFIFSFCYHNRCTVAFDYVGDASCPSTDYCENCPATPDNPTCLLNCDWN